MMKGGEDEIDRKSSTTNSMFIGTTISKPNVESIINAVATILHSQMLEVNDFFKFLLGLSSGKINFTGERPLLLFRGQIHPGKA